MHRLGLVMMAASPRGEARLDIEAEEDAVVGAVGAVSLDLVVEHTGTLDGVRTTLEHLPAMSALHLSCHGTGTSLLLEDEVGAAADVRAAELATALRSRTTLLVLSACSSADPRLGNLSIAQALVDEGVPAVLGWDGAVPDAVATSFATAFYARLAAGETIADAVQKAAPPGNTVQPCLLGRGDVRIADPSGPSRWAGRRNAPQPFVGRRRHLQELTRALHDTQHRGVLLHGWAGLGASALAARFTDRRHDHATATVRLWDGHLTPSAVVAACREAIQLMPWGRQVVNTAVGCTAEVDLDGMVAALEGLLDGPCSGRDDTRPLLLLLDGLHQVMNPGAPIALDPDARQVLDAVLAAFDPERTRSRVVLTSRWRIDLPGVRPLHVTELGVRDRRRLVQLTWAAAAPPDKADEDLWFRRTVWSSVTQFGCGNPALVDGLAAVLLDPAASRQQLRTTRHAIATALEHGPAAAGGALTPLMDELAPMPTLSALSRSDVGLLCACTTLYGPHPEPVIRAIADRVGGDADRLRALGLLEPFPDVLDPQTEALGVNALARTHVTPSPRAGALAATAAHPVLAQLRAAAMPHGLTGWAAAQLAFSAAAAQDGMVLSQVGVAALDHLADRVPGHARELASTIVRLVDHPTPALLASVIDANEPDPEDPNWQVVATVQQDTTVSPVVRGRLAIALTRHHWRAGRAEQARTSADEACGLCEQGSREHATAVYVRTQLRAEAGDVGAEDDLEDLARTIGVHHPDVMAQLILESAARGGRARTPQRLQEVMDHALREEDLSRYAEAVALMAEVVDDQAFAQVLRDRASAIRDALVG